MKTIILTAIIFITTLKSHGQVFIEDIQVGQKMPEQIDKGGFTDERAKDCSCKIFSIDHHVNSWEVGNGGAELGEIISIYYNENDTIIGIMKGKGRLNNLDAQQVYNTLLSQYMKTQSRFPNRQIIKVRDSDNGVADGIFYFIYTSDGGKTYRATGVIKNSIIEETYFPNSNFKPLLVN